MVNVGRREFIALAGGAATASYASWPLVAPAQQAALPAIGFLHLTSHDETRAYLPDFHQGLAEAGYVEGKNVLIEYRWGEGRNDRMPSLIADLVRRQVSVIVTLESTLTALAAKQATSTIPIIFMQGATRCESAWSRASVIPAEISPASTFSSPRSPRSALSSCSFWCLG